MFSILPASEEKAAALAKREGLTKPLSALVLTVGDEEQGYALFDVDRDTVELLCLRSPDGELEEWLVRAVLNAGANRNAITAVCRETVLFPLLARLGFAVSGEGYEVFIPEFFGRPCHGG